MILKPTKDNVFIDPIRDIGEKVTDGGIVMPAARKETGTNEGKILAVGPKVSDEVKVNMKAIFDKRFCGQEIKFGNKRFLMMKEEDILAVQPWE